MNKSNRSEHGGLAVRHVEIGPETRDFYKSVGYDPEIPDGEILYVAYVNDVIIGAARLVTEYGQYIIRGVQVHPNFQHQGVGAALIKTVLESVNNRRCYLVAYGNVRKFYEKLGFNEVASKDAPAHLAKRINRYRQEHPDEEYLLMAK